MWHLYSDLMSWFDHLDIQEWFMLLFAGMLFGFLCMRGYGSRSNY